MFSESDLSPNDYSSNSPLIAYAISQLNLQKFALKAQQERNSILELLADFERQAERAVPRKAFTRNNTDEEMHTSLQSFSDASNAYRLAGLYWLQVLLYGRHKNKLLVPDSELRFLFIAKAVHPLYRSNVHLYRVLIDQHRYFLKIDSQHCTKYVNQHLVYMTIVWHLKQQIEMHTAIDHIQRIDKLMQKSLTPEQNKQMYIEALQSSTVIPDAIKVIYYELAHKYAMLIFTAAIASGAEISPQMFNEYYNITEYLVAYYRKLVPNIQKCDRYREDLYTIRKEADKQQHVFAIHSLTDAKLLHDPTTLAFDLLSYFTVEVGELPADVQAEFAQVAEESNAVVEEEDSPEPDSYAGELPASLDLTTSEELYVLYPNLITPLHDASLLRRRHTSSESTLDHPEYPSTINRFTPR